MCGLQIICLLVVHNISLVSSLAFNPESSLLLKHSGSISFGEDSLGGVVQGYLGRSNCICRSCAGFACLKINKVVFMESDSHIKWFVEEEED